MRLVIYFLSNVSFYVLIGLVIFSSHKLLTPALEMDMWLVEDAAVAMTVRWTKETVSATVIGSVIEKDPVVKTFIKLIASVRTLLL